MSIKLLHGKVEKRVPELPESSFHAVFCDPPYGLKMLGKEWDHGVPSHSVWEKILRVLKPGGHLIAFGGTRTHHRLWTAVEDAGFEIRDSLMWIYGNGFPKSLNVSKALDKVAKATREVVGRRTRPDETAPSTAEAKLWNGYGTGLKPAYEPILLARRPLSGNVSQNILKHGAGALNIEGTRVPVANEQEYRANCPGDRGHEVRQGGSSIGLAAGAGKASSGGRWPANLIHDGSAEVTNLFPETKLTGIRKGTSRKATCEKVLQGFNGQAEVWSDLGDKGGSASRFFYASKVSKKERLAGCGMNDHPTLKPVSLCEYLARLLLTPEGSNLLIPYAGTGSEMIGAFFAGWTSICGIEQEREYNLICRERVGFARRFATLSEWSAAL